MGGRVPSLVGVGEAGGGTGEPGLRWEYGQLLGLALEELSLFLQEAFQLSPACLWGLITSSFLVPIQSPVASATGLALLLRARLPAPSPSPAQAGPDASCVSLGTVWLAGQSWHRAERGWRCGVHSGPHPVRPPGGGSGAANAEEFVEMSLTALTFRAVSGVQAAEQKHRAFPGGALG